jgi:hypothetical protein
LHTCIYSGVEFESASAEHILQNFLGARWSDSTIVCDKVQAEFGRTIDVALERAIQPLRNLVGSRGGRGETGPNVKYKLAKTGEPIELEPGGKPRLVRPKVEVQPHPSGIGHEINIEAGNKKQLAWAIAQLKQKLPPGALSPDVIQQIEKQASLAPKRLTEPVHIPLKLGGHEYFRGLAKSCFNLLALHTNVHEQCFDPIRAFVLSGVGDSSSFARWPRANSDPQLPSIGPFDHFIGIVSRDSRVEAVVRLFGSVFLSICLSDKFDGNAIHCGYLVDPTREAKPAENRKPDFVNESVPSFEDQPTKPDSSSRKTMTRSGNAFIQRYFDRDIENVAEKIVTDVLGPHDGERITAEMLAEIEKRVADFVDAHRKHDS